MVMISDETRAFVAAHRNEDVRDLALHAGRPDGVDMTAALDQIAGWRAARTKLPGWAACDDVWYPPHLSMEQCSSEFTAKYKADVARRLIGESPSPTTLVDLTGGFGVDFSYMARMFDRAVYVERQPHLCELAAHNMPALGLPDAEIVNADAESFLDAMPEATLVFLDPARRDAHGARTYAIADCTPDVLGMLDCLLAKAAHVMVKLSPMLDWHKTVDDFAGHVSEVHIVSTGNECKELLLVIDRAPHAAPHADRTPHAALHTDRTPHIAPHTDRTPHIAPHTDRTPHTAPHTDRTPHIAPCADRTPRTTPRVICVNDAQLFAFTPSNPSVSTESDVPTPAGTPKPSDSIGSDVPAPASAPQAPDSAESDESDRSRIRPTPTPLESDVPVLTGSSNPSDSIDSDVPTPAPAPNSSDSAESDVSRPTPAPDSSDSLESGARTAAANNAWRYLYEPNASIMKAGCFDELAARFGVRQIGPNSHLFVSDEPVTDFPGRSFAIERIATMNKKELRTALSGLTHANIAVRNFPLPVAALRKKLKLKDGGGAYLFATTDARGRHLVIRTRKV